MVATVKSCTLVGIDAEFVEVMLRAARHLGEIIATLRGERAPRAPSAGRVLPPGGVAVDMAEIEVARTIADLLHHDDIDASCLLEAAANRAVAPTAELVLPAR